MKAYSAIDILIGLVIISVTFIISVKSFKSVSVFNNKESDLKTVQEQVDEKITDIEKIRQESQTLQREILENN